ncbi:hypothetical protein TNCT6_56970 [Streptomyces sp. 6-11-2]|nr:hypothetical protein TNCT6_56970 [Streptomyces sp. 6-11-2]
MSNIAAGAARREAGPGPGSSAVCWSLSRSAMSLPARQVASARAAAGKWHTSRPISGDDIAGALKEQPGGNCVTAL